MRVQAAAGGIFYLMRRRSFIPCRGRRLCRPGKYRPAGRYFVYSGRRGRRPLQRPHGTHLYLFRSAHACGVLGKTPGRTESSAPTRPGRYAPIFVPFGARLRRRFPETARFSPCRGGRLCRPRIYAQKHPGIYRPAGRYIVVITLSCGMAALVVTFYRTPAASSRRRASAAL